MIRVGGPDFFRFWSTFAEVLAFAGAIMAVGFGAVDVGLRAVRTVGLPMAFVYIALVAWGGAWVLYVAADRIGIVQGWRT